MVCVEQDHLVSVVKALGDKEALKLFVHAFARMKELEEEEDDD